MIKYIQKTDNIRQYQNEITQRLKDIYEEVKRHDLEVKEKRQNWINKSQKDNHFKIGDLVWMYSKSKRPGYSHKLMARWHGPFRIVQFPTSTTVILKSLTNRILRNKIHISKLKKFKSMKRPSRPINVDDTDDIEYQEEFEVENILDIRKNRGIREYLIKWQGYSHNENTWEPVENLKHCTDKLIEFHEKRNLICDKCKYLSISERALRRHKKIHC